MRTFYKSGKIWEMIETIALHSGKSKRTVDKAIADLVKAELFVFDGWHVENGKRTAKRYIIDFERARELRIEHEKAPAESAKVALSKHGSKTQKLRSRQEIENAGFAAENATSAPNLSNKSPEANVTPSGGPHKPPDVPGVTIARTGEDQPIPSPAHEDEKPEQCRRCGASGELRPHPVHKTVKLCDLCFTEDYAYLSKMGFG